MSESRFFLDKKIHFYLTLAAIATTLSPWYNLNSWVIILLVICRLVDGKGFPAVKAAFSNKYFLAYFFIFLLDLLGLIYTHHFFKGWKYVESKATLVAIPFILCGGPFTDKTGRARLMSAWCLLLFIICLYCLGVATWQFINIKDPALFFYHSLTNAIHVNAVFFSAYVISALLFLLSSPLSMFAYKYLREALVLFFIGMIILLSSKLLLVLTLVILIAFLSRRKLIFSRRKLILIPALAAVLIAGVLMFTNNPVSDRYKDIMRGNIELYKQEKLPDFTVFNGVSLRLLIWRSAVEILREQKAWFYGVSAGDGQVLLNKKYVEKISPGYLNYNFHNQYIEIGVRSGIIGLIVFLGACWMLIVLARSVGTLEAWFTVTLVLLLYFTESMLETQHSAFYCCFFPLLLQFDAHSKTAHNG